jgi:hypothetical protein
LLVDAELAQAAVLRVASVARRADDLVALGEQEARQIGAVLAARAAESVRGEAMHRDHSL